MSTKGKTIQEQSSQDVSMYNYDVSPKGWSDALEVEGWLDSLSARFKESEEHILRVTEMTVALARMMGIPEDEIVHIRRGAMLHDIGKLGIPDDVLLTPEKLSEEEWDMMRKHPSYAYDLLYPIEHLRPCLPIPYSHHEKWDGSGYPQGLKGEQIPLAARIFSVVDAYDALTSGRPYRTALSKESALERIYSKSESHFDPTVVTMFMLLIKNSDYFSIPEEQDATGRPE